MGSSLCNIGLLHVSAVRDSRPALPLMLTAGWPALRWAKLPRQADGLSPPVNTDLLEESAGLQQPRVQEVPDERALPKPSIRLHVRTCTGQKACSGRIATRRATASKES